MSWTVVLAAAAGCYLFKLAGLSVPARFLQNPSVGRISTLLPVALLSALIATQAFSTGMRLTIDPRAAGLAVAAVAVVFRAPFIVVVILAAAATALVRFV